MNSRDRAVFAYEMDLEIRMANIYLKWAFIMEQNEARIRVTSL